MYISKNNEVFLTVVETMERYNVSRSTLYNKELRGELKKFKLKNKCMYSEKNLEALFYLLEVK